MVLVLLVIALLRAPSFAAKCALTTHSSTTNKKVGFIFVILFRKLQPNATQARHYCGTKTIALLQKPNTWHSTQSLMFERLARTPLAKQCSEALCPSMHEADKCTSDQHMTAALDPRKSECKNNTTRT